MINANVEDAVKIVKWVGWLAYNISFDNFTILLCKMIDSPTEQYINDHFEKMRNDPLRWFMNLDEDCKKAFVKAAMEKYDK